MNEIDLIAISYILSNFFDTLNPSNILSGITEYDYESNSAGHWGEFSYVDRDPKTENFWNRDQSLVKRFCAILALNNIERYGVRVVFFENRPFGTELFSMGIDVPEHIDKVSIATVIEE